MVGLWSIVTMLSVAGGRYPRKLSGLTSQPILNVVTQGRVVRQLAGLWSSGSTICMQLRRQTPIVKVSAAGLRVHEAGNRPSCSRSTSFWLLGSGSRSDYQAWDRAVDIRFAQAY